MHAYCDMVGRVASDKAETAFVQCHVGSNHPGELLPSVSSSASVAGIAATFLSVDDSCAKLQLEECCPGAVASRTAECAFFLAMCMANASFWTRCVVLSFMEALRNVDNDCSSFVENLGMTRTCSRIYSDAGAYLGGQFCVCSVCQY